MNVLRSWKHGTIVYNVNDSWIGRSLNLYGEYSEGEVDLFRRIVRPNDVVFDVGANIGVFTIFFAQQVGHGGTVLAFEPQRVMFQLLCANVALNNFLRVYCFNNAVGKARSSIRVPQFDYTNSMNMGLLELDKEWPDDIYSEQVEVVRLDEMGVTSCRLIKVDVEGMEQHVLEGAVETIQKHRPLLYLEDNQPARRDSLRQVVRGLEYEAWMHTPKVFSPNNHLGNQTNVFGEANSENLLCWPIGTEPPVRPEEFGMTKVV